MSTVLRNNNDSYRITNGPELNNDPDIYVFNGIRLDWRGKKDTVRMLFVRNTVLPEALKGYGKVERVCSLPSDFSDDRFHKKYNIETSANKKYDLYVARRACSPAERAIRLKRLLLLLIPAAVIALLIILAVAAFVAFKALGGSKEKAAPSSSGESSGVVITDGSSLGDMNGDGMINSIDASAVLANYIKLSTDEEVPEDEISRGDINRDGKADAIDASIIIQYYSYLSTSDYIPISEYYEKEYKDE